LKTWRESQDPRLSQEAAGNRVRVSTATWCDWENGNKVPTVDRAEDLEKLTDGAVTVPMWSEHARDKRTKRDEAAAARKEEGDHGPG
jgi:transcriptional regulator with XRE-family HTH domain